MQEIIVIFYSQMYKGFQAKGPQFDPGQNCDHLESYGVFSNIFKGLTKKMILEKGAGAVLHICLS